MIDEQEIIDFHGHVGRWDIFEMDDDEGAMIHAMDAVGIDRSCLFNIFHPDGTTGNDETAAFVERQPERFIGFAYVSPLMAEGMVHELARAIDLLGFSAIKIYPPYSSWDLTDSASSLSTPSFTALGAPSTSSLASLRPRVVTARTALIT
mgnify:CR=1 FL=1